ncbi:MAG: sulfur transferase domain-containing protein [Isosphaeraceae bacterium]
MQSRDVTPTIAIADQPSGADISALREGGYVGVVNLRQDGEPEQPIGVDAEGAMVRAHGIDYLHYAVGSAPLSAEGVSAVSDFIEQADGKVLVQCRKGGRAAALVLLHLARVQGWPASEVFERGEAIGLKVEGAGLRSLVSAYLERQAGG